VVAVEFFVNRLDLAP
jgi:hypothetical protein